jgi:hypothetical protein
MGSEKLFGNYCDGVGLPWGERYDDVGRLLDACADEAARGCWNSGEDDDVQYLLRVVHDAYFLASFEQRCVLPVPCEESTPDLSFADMVRVCSPTSPPLRSKADNFVAVLEKSVPRHCATRDFTRKCETLFVAPDENSTKALIILLCTLLGNFRHCQWWPCASKRRALLSVYATDNTAFGRQMRASNDKQRVLLFSAFREYMSVAVAHMPALSGYMNGMLGWHAIEQVYRETLDVCRREHEELSGIGCTAERVPTSTINRLTRARSCASAVNVLKPKQTFGVTVSRALVASFPFAARRYFTSPEDAHDWTLLLTALPRTSVLALNSVTSLLSAKGALALERAAAAWLDHGDLDGCLVGMSAQDASCLHNFFVARTFTQRFDVHPLPERIARKQAEAACKRFARLLCFAKESHRELAVQWASTMRVCAVCLAVRNFVGVDSAPQKGEKKRPTKYGDGAIGFGGCVHSTETGRISCKGTASASDRTELCRCAHLIETQLLSYNKDGSVQACSFKFQGVEYMLSPCCAFMCVRSSIRNTANGEWSCPRCVGESLVSKKQECVFCEKMFARSGALRVVSLIGSEGVREQFRFCKQHVKVWFVDTLSISEVLDRLTHETKRQK